MKCPKLGTLAAKVRNYVLLFAKTWEENKDHGNKTYYGRNLRFP
jgi:hypothetical protein